MAEVKHTPGPWSVENPLGADVGLWIVQSDLEPRQWSCIAMVTDDEDGQARDEGGRFIGRKEQEANARVIAAAPDMLEALRTTAGNLRSVIAAGNHRQFDEWLTTVDAAIAKAEGRYA